MPQYVRTRDDVKRFIAAETASVSRLLLLCPVMVSERQICCRHQILLRKAEYHVNNGHRIRGIIYRARLQRLQNLFGMHIPLNVFDIGMRIMHTGPILVNANAVIGKKCILHIGTSIVAGGTGERAPKVGDNVIFGVGAVALGDISIADGVAIGANAVVNKSIEEPNIAVAGVPAKKISNNGRESWGKKISCSHKEEVV